jgi:aspartyl-tRNA(Asn)/glutamyl-tRNA(Gln) amidotransferase subunit A
MFLSRFTETARARADRADEELAAGIDLGPLHGIPIGIKDVVAAAEGPTTAQGLVLDSHWGAGRDAPVTRRLRAAGAVIVGKTTTLEFAMGSGCVPFRSAGHARPRRVVPGRGRAGR